MLSAQDVLDGAQHADLVVPRAHDGALLHIRTSDVSGTSVRIDVVGTILHVILDDNDQGVGRVAAAGYRVDKLAERQVAVSLLLLGRVHTAKGGAEAAHVVMADPDQRQTWE